MFWENRINKCKIDSKLNLYFSNLMLFLLQVLSLLLELSLSMDMKAHFMTTTIFMEDPVLRNLHNMTTVGAIGNSMTKLVVKFLWGDTKLYVFLAKKK